MGVLSAYGGIGKTTTSLCLAMRLSQLYKKVLYIDAENIQNFIEKMPSTDRTETYADKEVAASLQNLTTNTYEYIKKQIIHGKFDYLPPFEKYLFNYHLSLDDIYRYVEALASKGEYDYIIVEFENAFNSATVQFINNMNKLVFVTKGFEDERMASLVSLTSKLKRSTYMLDTTNSETTEIYGIPVAESVNLDLSKDISSILLGGQFKKLAEAVL